ncbi:uncharacterized protein LOC106759015 isoform X1 [Vigna radiata var. radiata]|uniref:Uncharacterized protein LOC106759015 isoform X1 n=1 Tax=Vigna radiata var. radiata TaxID=3916 RepID=A0A1S3TUT6_VIGRR|nr:uncharacterized protein LOC106759015 isoform X1 [Vigna radiata var. radiata]
MAWEPSQPMLNPHQDRPQNIVNTLRNPQKTRKPTLSPELQTGSSSKFSLPEGWIKEERPRRSNPTHVDRYYYEPHTRKQFRSLSAVQKYLAGEPIPRRKGKPKKVETKLTESGEAQQSSSMRDVSDFLLEENTSSTASKSPMGEKRVRGTRCDGESVYKPSSLTKEELSWKYYIPSRKSTKLDHQNKTISESSGTSEHNLTSSPPAKVSWVLSGRTGNWNPKVDGSPVPQSEQVNWSEVFAQSIRRNDGPNN